MNWRAWWLAGVCAAVLPWTASAASADISVTGETAVWSNGNPAAMSRVNAQLAQMIAEQQTHAMEMDAAYQETVAEYPDVPVYVYHSEIKPVAETDRYLVMMQRCDSYMGGPHGDYSEDYFVFDKRTGERVTVSELAGESSRTLYPKLQAVVERELRERIWGDTDFWDDFLSELFAPERELNYTILPDGRIELVFNPYEVAAYAYGIVRIPVPRETVSVR